MRYVAVCADQITHVYMFRYRLGIAVNPAVVKVGFGRKCCGLGSAYHGSPVTYVTDQTNVELSTNMELGLLRQRTYLRYSLVSKAFTQIRHNG
jgi:hypothetical protein